jgi:predicted hydrocarbon binding protein
LSKLLLGRQLDWSEEGVRIVGENFCVQPIDLLIFLQNSLKKKDVLYKSAKESFYQFSRKMEMHASSKDVFMKYMLALIDHLGFGKIKILELKEKNVKLQLSKNNFASAYKKNFGRQKGTVDCILAGILAGFFSVYFGVDVECEENFCIAQGKSACSFSVHP